MVIPYILENSLLWISYHLGSGNTGLSDGLPFCRKSIFENMDYSSAIYFSNQMVVVPVWEEKLSTENYKETKRITVSFSFPQLHYYVQDI